MYVVHAQAAYNNVKVFSPRASRSRSLKVVLVVVVVVLVLVLETLCKTFSKASTVVTSVSSR